MDRKRRLPSNVEAALAELKAVLTDLYGKRLRGLYLFGSYARGDFREDSDVDVLIVLAGDVNPGAEISRSNQIVSDICLRYDLLISTVPTAEDWFNRQIEPLYGNIRREGVPV